MRCSTQFKAAEVIPQITRRSVALTRARTDAHPIQFERLPKAPSAFLYVHKMTRGKREERGRWGGGGTRDERKTLIRSRNKVSELLMSGMSL